MGSLLALVTPAQLSIIINTFSELLQRMNGMYTHTRVFINLNVITEAPSAVPSNNTVRAMGEADYNRIETLIGDSTPIARRGGNALSAHSAAAQWSAPDAHEQFYVTSARTQPSRVRRCVVVNRRYTL